jgi:translation initiation factor 1
MPKPDPFQHLEDCPAPRWPNSKCTCPEVEALPEGDGIVRVCRQSKGRKGKGVTLVTGVPLLAVDLKKLGKDLKKKCGTGGAVKDGVIEIQGDHRELLVAELKKHGWVVKLAGG